MPVWEVTVLLSKAVYLLYFSASKPRPASVGMSGPCYTLSGSPVKHHLVSPAAMKVIIVQFFTDALLPCGRLS